MGPCNHGWYTFLDKILPAVNPLVVVKKILMDQIVAAPFMAFGFFMGRWTVYSPVESMPRKSRGPYSIYCNFFFALPGNGTGKMMERWMLTAKRGEDCGRGWARR